MLWLALYLPRLPAEVFTRGWAHGGPFAVAQGGGRKRLVVACNDKARAGGIVPGFSVSAAHALIPELSVRSRDARAEERALRGLAAWAMQFTSWVSLQPPGGLLLEIAGSLRLFGGLDVLLERVQSSLRESGYAGMAGVAPTPLGAWWLARSGGGTASAQDLHSRLAALPIDVPELPPAILKALQGVGVCTLGHLLGLPRAGVARRYGQALVDSLDRALGRRPDPREPYRPPVRFHSRLMLPAEVEDSAALLFAARPLVLELCAWLDARAAGVDRLVLSLKHHRPPATRLRLGLVRPSRDAAHLLQLLREKLERLELSAAVGEIALSAATPRALAPATPSLYAEPAGQTEERFHVIERLRARLGVDAVSALMPVADHRPERAWGVCEPGVAAPPLKLSPRPLWLIDPPRPLAMRHAQPCLDGPLALQGGAERIESGWWDGNDVQREYYVAVTAKGERLWIYRDLKEGGWFWQGVFG